MRSYLKGRGAQFNPDNRFLKQTVDLDARDGIDDYARERPRTEVYLEHPKQIISKNDSPDLKMMYSINPYQGCEHGCVYCYARNSHQYWGWGSGIDFESRLIVKPNAPELLEKELSKPNWKVHPIMLSGNTDCYQPLERKYRLTRAILQVALKFRHPISIVTKNSLVKRDLDILSDLAQENLVRVYFSISSMNEELRGKLEPRTATSKSKLLAMETLSRERIPVGVMIAPVIPGLTHHEIPEILRVAAESGAGGAAYTILRLNGVIDSIMQDWLHKNMPDRKDKIWNQVADVHGGQVNDSAWGRRLTGTGPYAAVIKRLFELAYVRHFKDRSLPPMDDTKFRRSGHYTLF